ncbi:MAG: nucleoside deaminase [Clostridia bacterium]|nr:nucleoside deaminase [Clostridia bacterium]
MEKEFDIQMMNEALLEADKALSLNEVPVGAVIVCDGKIISKAYNTRETDKNALCHAEIKAINEACNKLGGWRLHKCDIYVTLEPCPMCAGAIINSRIKRVIFGAPDDKNGAFGTNINLNDCSFNFRPEVESGLLQEECSSKLSDFFIRLRDLKSK